MAREEEVAAAIEVFKKANCPGIVAFTEMLLEEEKEGYERSRTSMTLKDDPLKSLVLGIQTGSVLGDILVIAKRINELPEKALKIFDEICADVAKNDKQIKNASPIEHDDSLF